MVFAMYQLGKIDVSALIEFVQYSSFAALSHIIGELIISESFKITMVDSLMTYILDSFDQRQIEILFYKMMIANSDVH